MNEQGDPFVLQLVVANREQMVRGQLDTSIVIWSNYGDPVSVHTLAAAAHGILRGVGGKKFPSPLYDFLKTRPAALRRKITDPQNVFKHANKDRRVVVEYQPFIAEVILADATMLYQDIYGDMTPFMRAFTIRLFIERLGYSVHDLAHKITGGIQVDDLHRLNRPTCLDTVRARLRAVGVG